jgi:hypothetical protein
MLGMQESAAPNFSSSPVAGLWQTAIGKSRKTLMSISSLDDPHDENGG